MKSGALNSKSLAQLKEMAAELDIVGRHKMGKDQLIDAVLAARAKVAARQERLAAASARPLSARPPARTRAEAPASKKTAPAPKGKALSKPAVATRKPAPTVKAPIAKKATKVPAKGAAVAAAKKAAPKKPQPKKAAPAVKSRVAKIVAKPAAKSPAAKPSRKPSGKLALKAPAKPAARTAAKAPAKVRVAAKAPVPAKKPAVRKPAPVSVKPAARPLAKPAPAIKAAPAKPAPAPKAPAAAAPASKSSAKPASFARPAAASAPVKVPPERPSKPAPAAKPVSPGRPASRTPIRPIRKIVPRRLKRQFELTPSAPPINLHAGELDEAATAPRPATRVPKAEPAPAAGAAREHESIPTIYQSDDRVVLMPRDPQWLYCYWELSEPTMRALQESLDRFGGDLVVRVHDVTGVVYDGTNGRGHHDIVLPRQAEGSWYFQTLGEDIDHLIEVGIRTSDGKFLAIVRSNTVRTPRAASGYPESDQRHSMLTDLAQERAAAEASALESEALAHPSSPLKPIGPHGPQAAGPGIPSSPLGGWAPSSPFGPYGEGLLAPPVVTPEVKERGFWLVVDAELIVYGATVPGSRLKIQGQPMELRTDGTFSVRFALPDGQQVIPVESTSADGIDRLEITPIVERRTESSEESPE
ncbi:MAG: DUF4912 domain-containing protein [Candidatus Wallbacteria bacterium]|nr:DUF4912 domain-containing protein [Candidatus Wallbacteria bacterium]